MEAERDLAREFLALVVDLAKAAAAGSVKRADVVTLVTGAAIVLKVATGEQIGECVRVLLIPPCCEKHMGRVLWQLTVATAEAHGYPTTKQEAAHVG